MLRDGLLFDFVPIRVIIFEMDTLHKFRLSSLHAGCDVFTPVGKCPASIVKKAIVFNKHMVPALPCPSPFSASNTMCKRVIVFGDVPAPLPGLFAVSVGYSNPLMTLPRVILFFGVSSRVNRLVFF